MKRVMISQPVEGKTTEEILDVRTPIINFLTESGFDVIKSTMSEEDAIDDLEEFRDSTTWPSIYILGYAIHTMAICDAVYFCKGWESDRKSTLEHFIAEAYGLEIIYEENR